MGRFSDEDEIDVCPNPDCRVIGFMYLQTKLDTEDYEDGMAVYTGNLVKYVKVCSKCGQVVDNG